MSRQVILFIAGSVSAVASSFAVDLSYRWLIRRRARHRPALEPLRKKGQKPAKRLSLEDVRRSAILLLMLPFNPFILLGKTLALGYKTRTGLLYLILQSCWYVTLVALLRDTGWLLAGFGIGLHLSAILLGWEFYFREEW